MFSGELKDLLIKVISSWQVIAVTLAVLAYTALINYVSRARYRRKAPPPPGPAAKEKPKEEQVDDSELGLEE